jgi:outer membrane immunogenic protein
MSAHAGDLIAKPALEQASAKRSWTGLHIGVGVGASIFNSEWTTDCLAPVALPATCPNDIFGSTTRIGNDNPAGFDNSGLRLNLYLGLDWQSSSGWVLGIEGDVARLDSAKERIGIPGTWSQDFGSGQNSARVENVWDASLRARAGYLITPRTLVYSTGGIAFLHEKASASCEGGFPVGWCDAPHTDSASATAVGWTAGGGIERMIAPAWIIRGEYRYSDYGSRSFTLFDDASLDSVGFKVEQKESLAYIGLSRRF